MLIKLRSYAALTMIMALTIYVLNILKGTKDTLIVSKLGAEFISTIKLFGVMPSVVLFVFLYTKLATHLRRTQVYHALNIIFNAFFILFITVLYPYESYIKLDLSSFIERLPIFRYQFIMLEHWPYAFFYIMCELWGSVMLSLMFWQVLNQISTIKIAKSIYPKLTFVGEFGLIMAGILGAVFTSNYWTSSWDVSLKYICISVFVAGCGISGMLLLLSWWEPSINQAAGSQRAQGEKLTTYQSLQYVLRSPTLRKIIIILFCYGASINLLEGPWKAFLHKLYPSSMEYGHYMAMFQFTLGISSFGSLILSSYILKRISWVTAASITPILATGAGSIFFIVALYSTDIANFIGNINEGNILYFAILLGALHGISTKAFKFGFFEPSKEMVFITLNEELRTKGKGVAEIAGERFGKACGAAIQWSILALTIGSSLITIAPMLFIAFMCVGGLWLYTVWSLNRELALNGDHVNREIS